MARAVWFTESRKAELVEEELRPREPHEITVQAELSLVSQGSEMNLYRGEGNLPDLMLPGCEGTLPFPIKFGYQVIGEIVEAPDDSPWEVGRHVFCAFPHQERFHLDPSSGLAQPVPADIDLRRAMFAGMFGVALNASKDGPVRPGDVVAISGLGLIGLFQAHLARKVAGKLVLVEPNPERRKRAEWIGADAIVAPDEAPAAIEELAEGRGVDFFFEASGAPPALQLALDTTGVAGTIVPLAWYGTRTVSLRLSPEFHLKRQRIISSHVYATIFGAHPGWDGARATRACMDYTREIDLDQVISHELPFDRAPEAYSLIDRGEEPTLGVLLDYRDADGA